MSLRTPMQFRLRLMLGAVLAFAGITSRASAQIAVLGSTLEEHIAVPGESYRGAIVIRNVTDQTQRARIYQTDYVFFADGTSRFDSAGTLSRSNARWVALGARSISIPASSEVTVTYEVRVPRSDSLVGTYWSAIMVEGEKTPPPASQRRAQVGVGSILRYAVQVATHIGSTGSRTIKFTRTQLVANQDSTKSFNVDVENTGQRAYKPALWIEVYDAQGALQKNVRQERGLLFPGTSLQQSFELGKLPAGSYRAIVFADSGDDAVFASQFTLKF
ncbi:MAG TPA: hypothetical protein VJ867_03030 [Gemmatimonadaceae bacterium]|nr:hypothetical protein [Gemmatimonadaceae bacterium]